MRSPSRPQIVASPNWPMPTSSSTVVDARPNVQRQNGYLRIAAPWDNVGAVMIVDWPILQLQTLNGTRSGSPVAAAKPGRRSFNPGLGPTCRTHETRVTVYYREQPDDEELGSFDRQAFRQAADRLEQAALRQLLR